MDEERRLQRELEEARSHITRVGMLLGVACPEARCDETVTESWRRWMEVIEHHIAAEKQLLPIRLAAAIDPSGTMFTGLAADLPRPELNS